MRKLNTVLAVIFDMDGLMLDWLEKNHVPKAVATSTRHERARFKLDRAGIGRRFSIILGGDQVARGKPAPDIYFAAAAGLGIAAEQCLALEDSSPGVRAAIAAGMRAIMVPDVIPPSPDVVALGHLILPSLSDVRAWLAGEASASQRTMDSDSRCA